MQRLLRWVAGLAGLAALLLALGIGAFRFALGMLPGYEARVVERVRESTGLTLEFDSVYGRIFGKPVDEAECLDMLGTLAGRTHAVHTAVALWHDGRLRQTLDTSYVTFRDIDVAERRRYWQSGEPAGKAGGYAIQGLGAVFVTRLEGSFSGVMGLPLAETAALLDAAGVRRWQPA